LSASTACIRLGAPFYFKAGHAVRGRAVAFLAKGLDQVHIGHSPLHAQRPRAPMVLSWRACAVRIAWAKGLARNGENIASSLHQVSTTHSPVDQLALGLRIGLTPAMTRPDRRPAMWNITDAACMSRSGCFYVWGHQRRCANSGVGPWRRSRFLDEGNRLRGPNFDSTMDAP